MAGITRLHSTETSDAYIHPALQKGVTT